MIEFKKLPSLSRLFRQMVVTEKMDGTQSTIIFQQWDGDPGEGRPTEALLGPDGTLYEVGAQSKNRLLLPGAQTDNYGFAEWVLGYRYELFDLLGPGRHSGEWWGRGIQRNYGLEYRNFSLFNPAKLGDHTRWIGGAVVGSVPTLFEGPFSTEYVEELGCVLQEEGSSAVPGFMKPEGLVVFHVASGQSFKFTLDANDKHKWQELDSAMEARHPEVA